ncbi:MAG: hypothetical protein ACJ8E2_02550, partial [Bradyrhizobium sp.]
SRGDFTLHNEHLVFPAIFFIAPKAQDQMAKPPGISMQEWTEEPLFGTKHSGYAETEGKTSFRIAIRSGSVSAVRFRSGLCRAHSQRSRPVQHNGLAIDHERSLKLRCAVGWDAPLVKLSQHAAK